LGLLFGSQANLPASHGSKPDPRNRLALVLLAGPGAPCPRLEPV
jgi:hypothetical protein